MLRNNSEKKGLHRETDSSPGQSESSLPNYSVRISGKARRISLRVLPGKGLEVVLPKGTDPALAPEVVRRNRAWVDRALNRMYLDTAGQQQGLPERLLLKGGLEEVEIRFKEGEYRAGPAEPGQDSVHGIHQPGPVRRLLVLPEREPELAFRRLRNWLREEARAYLGSVLDELAREHGFAYASLSIRFQRSRWGSCSIKKNISLNAALLFLPDRLIRYIVAHELCHTRQMNHSEKFWKLLFAVDPDALAKDKAMRRAWRYVPDWLFT